LLDDNLRFQEIAVSSDNTAVMGRTTPILRVGAADAKLAGETPAAVAADVAKQLRSALWAEFLRNNS
jgi:hypothetical protein